MNPATQNTHHTSADIREWLRHNKHLGATRVADELKRDLLLRWLRGERAPAEEYLQLLAEAVSDSTDEHELNLIRAEILVRRELGEPSTFAEFQARFPKHSEKIETLFDSNNNQATNVATQATAVGTTSTAGYAADSPRRSEAIPDIDGYESLKEIGRGGMGVVYSAHQVALGRDVAIKTILPELADDPRLEKEFAREVRITARLPHPGVPPVHTLGTLADGRPYLAMKLIRV